MRLAGLAAMTQNRFVAKQNEPRTSTGQAGAQREVRLQHIEGRLAINAIAAEAERLRRRYAPDGGDQSSNQAGVECQVRLTSCHAIQSSDKKGPRTSHTNGGEKLSPFRLGIGRNSGPGAGWSSGFGCVVKPENDAETYRRCRQSSKRWPAKGERPKAVASPWQNLPISSPKYRKIAK